MGVISLPYATVVTMFHSTHDFTVMREVISKII